MNQTQEAVDLAVLVDMPPPCEYSMHERAVALTGHDHPAVWLATVKRCCEEPAVLQRRYCAICVAILLRLDLLKCPKCNQLAPPSDWLIHLEPL